MTPSLEKMVRDRLNAGRQAREVAAFLKLNIIEVLRIEDAMKRNKSRRRNTTLEVAELLLQGHTTKEVAARLNISANSVHTLASKARSWGVPLPRKNNKLSFAREDGFVLKFPVELANKLQPHAIRRNATIRSLVILILEACVSDEHLIDNVLDDGQG